MKKYCLLSLVFVLAISICSAAWQTRYISSTVVSVGIINYAGCRAYTGATPPVISNYVKQVPGSTLDLLPLLSDLNTNGAAYAPGVPLETFALPPCSSIWVSNLVVNAMMTNMYYDDLPTNTATDVFGNQVAGRLLFLIAGTNRCLVTTNGGVSSCALQTSSDFVNWLNLDQVIFAYIGVTTNGAFASSTAVVMTPDLRHVYSTNFCQYGMYTNSNDSFTQIWGVLRSWTIAPRVGLPTINNCGFARLVYWTNCPTPNLLP